MFRATAFLVPVVGAVLLWAGSSPTAGGEVLESVGQPAVEPLVEALGDADSSMRETAARNLGKLSDRRVLEPLLEALKDRDSAVRQTAAEALGELGDSRAVEPLIEMLKDRSLDVRRAAAAALVQIGPAAVEPLIAALKHRDPAVREAAARILSQLGDRRAVVPVIEALQEGDPLVRCMAAEALEQLGDRRAVEPLIAALKDECPLVRIAAARALAHLQDRRAVEPLMTALGDPDALVRRVAAWCLGQLGDRRAMARLVAKRNSDEWPVQKAAATALIGLGYEPATEREKVFFLLVQHEWNELVRSGQPAVEVLVAALSDSDWFVRQRAAEALKTIGKPAVGPLLAELTRRRSQWLEAAVENSSLPPPKRPADVQSLLAAMTSDDWLRHDAAIDELKKAGERAVEPLLAALKNPDWRIRRAAAEALGHFGDPRTVEPLVRRLEDENPRVRKTAALALAQLGEPPAEKLLLALLEDKREDPLLRQQAAQCLAKLAGRRAVPHLLAVLDDPDPTVCVMAVEILGELGDRRAVRPVMALLGKDVPWTRCIAAEVLGKLGDRQAIRPLLGALENEHSDHQLRVVAAKALEQLGYRPKTDHERAVYFVALGKWGEAAALGQVALEPLLAALDDGGPSVQQAAAQALGQLGHSRAVPALVRVLEEENSLGVRRAVVQALEKLRYEPSTEKERASFLVAQGKWDEAARLGRGAVAPLMEALNEDDPQVRRAVASALERIGRPATEALLANLGTGDRLPHWGPGWCLMVPCVPTRLESLLTALEDCDSRVRCWAAEKLADLADPLAVEPLLAALHDGDSAVRCQAARSLGRLADRRAVEPLIAALKDENTRVQNAAAWALGQVGDRRAVGPLIDVLANEASQAREMAAMSLGLLADRAAVEPLLAVLQNGTDEQMLQCAAIVALGQLADHQAIKPLAAALRTGGPWLRAEVARALGRMGSPEAGDLLLPLLGDSDVEVRLAAIEALGQLGYKKAVAPLIAVLQDDRNAWYVRNMAAEVLNRFGYQPSTNREKVSYLLALGLADDIVQLGPGAVEPLVDVLDDRDPYVRHLAAEILGQLRAPRTVEPLTAVLKDPNWQVCMAAAEALNRLGYAPRTKHEKALFLALEGKWDEMAQLGPVVVDVVVCALDCGSVDVAGPAAELAGQLGDSAAVAPLVALLEHVSPWLRMKAADALGKLSDHRAVEPLVAALPDWEAGPAIAEALNKLGFSPRSALERVYWAVANRDRATLTADWQTTRRVLLADLTVTLHTKQQTAVFALVALGRQETVPQLIHCMNEWGGSERIAGVYWNCGHPWLERAARAWAKNRGYSNPVPQQGELPRGPRWGEM